MSVKNKAGVNWNAGGSWGTGFGETGFSTPISSFLNTFSGDFNGAANTVYLTGSDTMGSLNGVRRATFSYWAKYDTAWGNASINNVAGRSLNKATTQVGSWILDTGDGTVHHHVRLRLYTTDTSTTTGGIHSASLFSAGAWRHIIFVFEGDGATNAARLRGWVDGVERTMNYTGTIPTSIRSSSAMWTMGIQNWAAKTNPFGAGNIDEFAVWPNLALSQSQINEIYNNGEPPNLNALTFANPSYWFRFGDGPDDTATRMPNVNGSTTLIVCYPTGSGFYVRDTP